MRFLIAAAVAALLGLPAAAQRPTPLPTAAKAQGPKPAPAAAKAARPAALVPTRPARLACAPLAGQVFDPNGAPLMGATLLVKGTQQVYVTDVEGRFQLTAPVYQGQVVAVQAAGFVIRDVPLTDCTLPRLVLERKADAHIRRSGKRTGQVVRIGKMKL